MKDQARREAMTDAVLREWSNRAPRKPTRIELARLAVDALLYAFPTVAEISEPPSCKRVPSLISASGASCTYPRGHAGPHSWELGA